MAMEGKGLSEELEALRRTIEEIPPATNEEERQAVAGLEELLHSLEKLAGTVNTIGKQREDDSNGGQ